MPPFSGPTTSVKTQYDADREAEIRDAIAWKYVLDSGEDADEITRRRKRLRATDEEELLWEYNAGV
ncbi:MAG: hypothetical protein ACKO0Z_25305 [Betaproteobacteria bacterium]